MKSPAVSSLVCVALLLAAALSHADVKLPAIISDHMVLQKSDAVPVWGKADPGEKVEVTLGRQTQKTVTNEQGRWRVILNLKDSAAGPWQLVVQGKSQLTVSDVLVGEVWIASGQSNMEFLLREVLEAKEEIARAANPLIRHFDVENNAQRLPVDDCKGRWVVSTPETAGQFSAVAYYFGKTIQGELHVPVGVVNSTWGGSPCEAWISREAIDRDPELKAGTDRMLQKLDAYPVQKQQFATDFSAWLKEKGREDKPCASPEAFAGVDIKTSDWSSVEMPGEIKADGFSGNGAVWIRREIEVPAASAGRPIRVELGVFSGFQTIFWNGQKLDEMNYQTYPGKNFYTRCHVPAPLVKPGRNVLAIRVYAPAEVAKLANQPVRMMAIPVPISGEWKAKMEYPLASLSPEEIAVAPKAPENTALPHHVAVNLFNGMIHPIIPYAMRGVIWYQGESNAGRAVQYRSTFPMMIRDWRQRWGRGDFPFIFCQLANFMAKQPQPKESEWAELREAQDMALKLPNTAQAVLVDVGESEDIHPRNKADVGKRLAWLALNREYKNQMVSSGPVYESATVEGDKIRIKFSNTSGGLVARELPATYGVQLSAGRTAPLVRNRPQSQIEGFALCGSDRKWVWADAKIEGESVLVYSNEVPNPVAVRYAWADNPTCNLYNGGGLPAAPFRTDHFPEITKGKTY